MKLVFLAQIFALFSILFTFSLNNSYARGQIRVNGELYWGSKKIRALPQTCTDTHFGSFEVLLKKQSTTGINARTGQPFEIKNSCKDENTALVGLCTSNTEVEAFVRGRWKRLGPNLALGEIEVPCPDGYRCNGESCENVRKIGRMPLFSQRPPVSADSGRGAAYIFGSATEVNGQEPQPVVQRFDKNADEARAVTMWRYDSILPSSYSSPKAIEIEEKDQVYLIGGVGQNGQGLSDIFVFDRYTGTISRSPGSLPSQVLVEENSPVVYADGGILLLANDRYVYRLDLENEQAGFQRVFYYRDVTAHLLDNAVMKLASDGKVYIFNTDLIFQLDPVSIEMTQLLSRSPININRRGLFAFGDDVIHYYNDYRNPEAAQITIQNGEISFSDLPYFDFIKRTSDGLQIHSKGTHIFIGDEEYRIGGTFRLDQHGIRSDRVAHIEYSEDGQSGQEKVLGTLPEPLLRSTVAMAPNNDGIYFFGGQEYRVGSGDRRSKKIIEFDISSGVPLGERFQELTTTLPGFGGPGYSAVMNRRENAISIFGTPTGSRNITHFYPSNQTLVQSQDSIPQGVDIVPATGLELLGNFICVLTGYDVLRYQSGSSPVVVGRQNEFLSSAAQALDSEQNTMYLIGGLGGRLNVRRFDPSQSETDIPVVAQLAEPRFGSAASMNSLANEIMIFGGDDTPYLASLYDTTTWQKIHDFETMEVFKNARGIYSPNEKRSYFLGGAVDRAVPIEAADHGYFYDHE